MKSNDNKQRLFEIMQKVDGTYNLNETKAFGQLRKLNKKLYDKTIDLENEIGDSILKMIDNSVKKLNYNTKEEKELVYLIILDLLLSRFLDKDEK